MLPYFGERFGNPSSVHGFGREAREGLETAREQIAHFLRVGKEEIVFTSGGTESDNMAVKGVAMARRPRPHHHVADRAPRGAARRARPSRRWASTRPTCRWTSYGMVDPDDVRRALRRRHHPDHDHARELARSGPSSRSAEIGRIARERGIPFHVDARPDLRQGADRPRRLRHRPAVVLEPQDLRSQGRCGTLHPQGHQDGVGPARRRARAAPAGRHRERGRHRRLRQGGGGAGPRHERRRPFA